MFNIVPFNTKSWQGLFKLLSNSWVDQLSNLTQSLCKNKLNEKKNKTKQLQPKMYKICSEQVFFFI